VSTESPILNGPPPSPAAPSPEPAKLSRSELWLQRLKVAITVIFFIELGMVLVVIPWTFLWDDNKLLIMHPSWRTFVVNGFTRGVVTGLGLINVWIGIWEAVHYTEKDHN
jgi:hypothetical protein